MLLPVRLSDGIRDGSVTVAYRSWKRPTVRAGGTLQSHAGLLAIDAVDPIDVARIDDAAVASTGEPLDRVLAGLRIEPDRTVYRITFHRQGDDPRIALRAADELTAEEVDELDRRLSRLDVRSGTGPWTMAVLRSIEAHPGTVSTELAAELGVDRAPFKLNVRKLKALGLTESLEVGYRLSPGEPAISSGAPTDRTSTRPPQTDASTAQPFSRNSDSSSPRRSSTSSRNSQ